MSPSTITILVLAGIVHCANGLFGSNVCFEQQNYSLTTRVKYQQPVIVRTYTWCLGIPPRCSSAHTEMREKWKVQTVQQSKTVEVCCEGFREDEDRCVPKCPAGATGEHCDKDCPLDRWGTSCHQECRCPENSECDSKNGKCICLDGWVGSNCNVLRDSIRKSIPILSKVNTNRATKTLFDWSTPMQATTENTKFEIKQITELNYNTSTVSTARTIYYPSTEIYYNFTASPRNVATSKLTTAYKTTTKDVTTTQKLTTTIPTNQKPTTEKSTTEKSTTEKSTTQESTTHKPTTQKPTTQQPSTQKLTTKKPTTPMPTTHKPTTQQVVTKAPGFVTSTTRLTVDRSTSTPSTTVKIISPNTSTPAIIVVHVEETSSINNKTLFDIEAPIEPNNPISQIESPNMKETGTTDSPFELITHNSNSTESRTTFNATEVSVPFIVSTTTVSTAKRKQSKIYKVESDILNITLHSTGTSNETNFKIFKTVTLPTVSNTTRKASQPKGKYMHESKMITIPVRVIMDTGKVQPSLYIKKYNNSWIRNEATTARAGTLLKKFYKAQARTVSPTTNITLSSVVATDNQTEEIKHVLTEPEQITSVAGSADSDDRQDDLFSVLSIAAGVAVAIILTGFVIVLVARCRTRRGLQKRQKHLEMDHVQSMMSVSEDDLSSGYMRNIFHSPLPDPPCSQNIDKRFSVPFMQPVLIHAISPDMIENFRGILECHYDHPKPPRPTSFSSVPRHRVYELPPSGFTNLNTLPRISESPNHSNGFDNKTEFCFPVTDAAINVLKMEHQNQYQTQAIENQDPVYDEIPPWSPTPVCTSVGPVMTIGDEAVTEL